MNTPVHNDFFLGVEFTTFSFRFSRNFNSASKSNVEVVANSIHTLCLVLSHGEKTLYPSDSDVLAMTFDTVFVIDI